MNVNMSSENAECDFVEQELRSIDKVWHKFDNYIQLRESLLDRSCRKFEAWHRLAGKLDRLVELGEKRLRELLDGGEPFEEGLRVCENDLRKAEVELKKWEAEEHCSQTEAYSRRVGLMKKRLDELVQAEEARRGVGVGEEARIEMKIITDDSNEDSGFEARLDWIERKRRRIEQIYAEAELACELGELDRLVELVDNEMNEAGEMRDRCCRLKGDNEDDAEFKRNHFEIYFNLLQVFISFPRLN